jgi:hypothetical protein
MCLQLEPLVIGFFSFFFLLRPFTVLVKQTRQAVLAIKESIFLDVYGCITQAGQGKQACTYTSSLAVWASAKSSQKLM